MQEMWVRSLDQEYPLEEEMATHSSILAWAIPWTEEPSGLQSMGSQRVGHDWATEQAQDQRNGSWSQVISKRAGAGEYRCLDPLHRTNDGGLSRVILPDSCPHWIPSLHPTFSTMFLPYLGCQLCDLWFTVRRLVNSMLTDWLDSCYTA